MLHPLAGSAALRLAVPRRAGMLAGKIKMTGGLPLIRSRRARPNTFAARSSCRRETRNGSYVVIPSASRRSRSALSAALVPLGGAVVLLGLARGVSMWLARSSLMLTSSRSRHSAHLSQASESACQPDCPSRSDARRDASLHSCARFRQSATLIIAFTPPNALYRNLTQNGSAFNSSKRQTATLSSGEKKSADHHSIAACGARSAAFVSVIEGITAAPASDRRGSL
jgi:hypothetical protein